MKLSFLDLFESTQNNQIIAKKNIRFGALVIPINQPIDPEDPQLGINISNWKTCQFDVDISTEYITIKQIIQS